jgi:dTDP-glucose 4,6-dehydratase/UDP-glucuronate decarboxylase
MKTYLKNYLTETIEENKTINQALGQLNGCSCLVTGGNGIIGYAMSNLLDGHSECNLNVAIRNNEFKGKNLLSDKVKFLDYNQIKNQKYDYIFHCASYSEPSRFLSEWESTMKLNIEFLLDLLSQTKNKLIFSGSTEVYSGNEEEVTENSIGQTQPQHPRGIYIESKRAAEAACAISGVGRVSRIALASGPFPKENDTRVLYELIRKGLRQGFIELMGGHKNIRQYQYSGACVMRMLVSGLLGNELVYNNAGPYLITLEDLAKEISKKINVDYVDSKTDKNMDGAPKSVNISMKLFNSEFPQMQNIDPTFDKFIEWIINECQ